MGLNYTTYFLHGFVSGTFNYFIILQKESLQTGSPLISKLVRVYHTDRSTLSYSEIPIQCYDSEGNLHKHVQAAYVTRLGSELAAELGIGVHDDVLFATFTSSDSPGSVICRYTLEEINSNIAQRNKECTVKRPLENVDNSKNGIRCPAIEIPVSKIA